MNALVIADVPNSDVGSATIIWIRVVQATNALGISLSAILLAVSAQLSGEGPGQLEVSDCRITLLVMAVISMTCLLHFRRLPRDAGSHVSGHNPSPSAREL
jgi:hypothetical protein